MPLPVLPPATAALPAHALVVSGASSTAAAGPVRLSAPRTTMLRVRGAASGAIMRGPHPSYYPSFPGVIPTDTPDPSAPFVSALSLELVQPPVDAWPVWFTSVLEPVPGRVKLDWLDKLSDVGVGNVELLRQIGDGAGNLVLNPGVAQWNQDRYMVAKVWGRPAIALIREASTDTIINAGEESQETLAVTNAPSSAMKLADTVVRCDGAFTQQPLPTELRMDWTTMWSFTHHRGALDLDYARFNALAYANDTGGQINDPNALAVVSANWPDFGARWIWDRPQSLSPPGTCIFYRLFASLAGRYQLWTANKGGPYEVWLNGVKVAEDTKPYTGQSTSTEIQMDGVEFTTYSPSGDLFAIKAQTGGNAGFMLSMFPLNDNGTIGTTPKVRSNSTFRVISYPAEAPGMTAGNIILSLLALAADTGGQFKYWGTTFTGDTDSAGRAWPILYGVSFKIGSTVLDALRQLADSDIDWGVWPTGYMLNAYVKDSLGIDQPMALTSGYGNPAGNLRKFANNWQA